MDRTYIKELSLIRGLKNIRVPSVTKNVMDRVILEQCVEFVKKNKRWRAFRGWSDNDLRLSLMESYINQTMAISHDGKWNINGLVVGQIKDDTFHVLGIIATYPGVLAKLFGIFWILYPHLKLTGNRRGTLRTFNAHKLAQKFIKQ